MGAWWTTTVREVKPDGTVDCLSDPTPTFPEQEEWEVGLVGLLWL